MQLHLLLLDEGFMSGALTAIGLRDAGCRVTIAAAVGGRSHYDAQGIAWSLAPSLDSTNLLPTIDALVRQHDVDYVLPLTEPLQALLWDRPMAWSNRIFPRPGSAYRALLRDKYCLSEFVGHRGVRIPKQVRLDDGLEQAIESLGLPMVVKGATGSGGRRTWIVRSLGEARKAVARMRREAAASFAQRYVSGPTFLVGGMFSRGRPLRIYAGVKLAQYPRRTGPASLIDSVRDEELLNEAYRVFAALEWTGVASADFVRDADGRYWFLELNPRPWGSIAAARAAGVDLWSPLVTLLRGEDPEADLRYVEGVAYPIFPLALLSLRSWRSPRGILGIWRAEKSEWRPVGQGLHLTHRLIRMAARWAR